MVGKLISGRDINGVKFEDAQVLLVYNDALASGNNDYVQITQILSRLSDGKIITVLPREIRTVSAKIIGQVTTLLDNAPKYQEIKWQNMCVGKYYYDSPDLNLEMELIKITDDLLLFKETDETIKAGYVTFENDIFIKFNRDTTFYTKN